MVGFLTMSAFHMTHYMVNTLLHGPAMGQQFATNVQAKGQPCPPIVQLWSAMPSHGPTMSMYNQHDTAMDSKPGPVRSSQVQAGPAWSSLFKIGQAWSSLVQPARSRHGQLL